MGNTSDKTGSINIDSLVVGEYALAIKNYINAIENETISHSGILIYPNPGDENITVKSDNKTDSIIEITVVDTLGKTVIKENRNGNSNTCIVNTKQLKNGSYTVIVKTTKSTISKKIIIAH